MTLDEATSKEEVEAALEAGDEELRDDIEWQLDQARRYFDRHGFDNAEYDREPLGDIVDQDAFIDAVIEASPYDLGEIPRHRIRSELRTSLPVHDRHGRLVGVFEMNDSPGHYFSFEVPTEIRIFVNDLDLPDNAEFIPEEMAKEFWDSLSDGWIEWEQTHEVGNNWGFAEGDPVYVVDADPSLFHEWARDLRADYINDFLHQEPVEAAKRFVEELPSEYAEPLASALGLGEPRCVVDPDDELFDLMHRWFVGDDRAEVLEELDPLRSMVAPTGEPPEVIREVTREDLRQAGVTKGTLWEEAPWKLVKLRPSDLRYEGTRMRHCVGDRSMDYLRALAEGEVEIWSLRSRNDKPRFTLEVDPVFWEWAVGVPVTHGSEPYPEMERAQAIVQLKGKANRTPGYAQKGSKHVKFPEEVRFWAWLLTELGVDPIGVEDFEAYRLGHGLRRVEPNRSFDKPWSPPC